MQVEDLIKAMEIIAPTRHAEAWDNVGLLVGDAKASLSRLLLTIDLGIAQVQEAKQLGCEAVIAYHPPIFKEVRRLLSDSPVYEAIRAGIAIYSPHTALDVAQGGTNDSLAEDVLGTRTREALHRRVDGTGMGKIGVFDPPMPRVQLLERIKKRLALEHVLVAGPQTGVVRNAAVCAGSCGSLVELAVSKGVDLYLTGEMSHHNAFRAASRNMTVVCVLHSHSERLSLQRLKKRLQHALPNLDVMVSQTDNDPFDIC